MVMPPKVKLFESLGQGKKDVTGETKDVGGYEIYKKAPGLKKAGGEICKLGFYCVFVYIEI